MIPLQPSLSPTGRTHSEAPDAASPSLAALLQGTSLLIANTPAHSAQQHQTSRQRETLPGFTALFQPNWGGICRIQLWELLSPHGWPSQVLHTSLLLGGNPGTWCWGSCVLPQHNYLLCNRGPSHHTTCYLCQPGMHTSSQHAWHAASVSPQALALCDSLLQQSGSSPLTFDNSKHKAYNKHTKNFKREIQS